jgi:hypothetical protein
MLNFNQLSEKISGKGYRRNATARHLYNEEDGTTTTIYDFEHRKKLDMFTVYLNEAGAVELVEFTKVDFNPETKRYQQTVTEIRDTATLNKYLG